MEIHPRRQPETLRLKSLRPCLTVNDLAASLAWYRDVVGFHVAEEMKQDGRLNGVSLRAGAVELILVQDDFAKGRDRDKGVGLSLYCNTRQDLDRLAKSIERRGGKLAQQPTQQPWGARDFALVDPDGFKIIVAVQGDPTAKS